MVDRKGVARATWQFAILFIALVGVARADCSHSLSAAPSGELLVYRNGVLQRETADYTLTLPAPPAMPVVVPIAWNAGDSWSAVFLWTFDGLIRLRREDWTCNASGVIIRKP